MSAVSSSIDAGIGPGRTTGKQSALPQSAEVLAQMGPCGSMEAITRTSLTAGGAGATDGTALPTGGVITSYIVGPSSTAPGDAAAGVRPSDAPERRSKNDASGQGHQHSDSPKESPLSSPPNNAPASSGGVQLPPAVLLWMQCVLVAAEVLWMVMSKVWSWVSVRCAGLRARNEQPDRDRQDCRARGDTLTMMAPPPSVFGTRMAAWTSTPRGPFFKLTQNVWWR